MTLGEKIQICRKSKSLSQEELASILGVSRQAISKWENNTSIPDINKIISLSNYFDVSIDYLLKDEKTNDDVPISKNENQISKSMLNGYIPVVVSTSIIIIGLIIAIAMINDGSMFVYWRFRSVALGIVIQVIGICIFEILYFSRSFKIRNQYLFWSINTWLLSVIPIVFLGILLKLMDICRVIYRPIDSKVVSIYFILNIVVTLFFYIFSRKRVKEN